MAQQDLRATAPSLMIPIFKLPVVLYRLHLGWLLGKRFMQLTHVGRRSERGLSSALVEYERQREWLEGSAKYVELAIWRAAAAGDYVATAAIAADPDFQHYRTFEGHWEQEVAQIGRSAAGDGRFYYSGMAQAMLLERLAPGWQGQLVAEGVWLESLLAEALP